MVTRKGILRFVELLTALIIVGALVYQHNTSSPLSGWWIKQSGAGPKEMTVRMERGHFKMSYQKDLGERMTMTLLVDGRGHPFSSEAVLGSVVTATTYWAELKGNTLLLTKKVELPSAVSHHEDAWTESWTASADGHHLTIAVPGQPDTVYERAPLRRWFFRGSP